MTHQGLFLIKNPMRGQLKKIKEKKLVYFFDKTSQTKKLHSESIRESQLFSFIHKKMASDVTHIKGMQ